MILTQVPLYVTFTYTAEELAQPSRGAEQKKEDDAVSASAESKSRSKSITTESGPSTSLKSFSFWTSVLLGEVVPRTFPTAHAAAGSSVLVSGGAAGGAAGIIATNLNAGGTVGTGAKAA